MDEELKGFLIILSFLVPIILSGLSLTRKQYDDTGRY